MVDEVCHPGRYYLLGPSGSLVAVHMSERKQKKTSDGAQNNLIHSCQVYGISLLYSVHNIQ